MKTEKILQSGLFNVAQISREIGISHPSMLHQKLSNKKGNKLTDKDLTSIKALLEKLLQENEVFNLGELCDIFECITSAAEEETLANINQYQEKYADIGLVEFYENLNK